MEMRRVLELDGLRGLACLLVVCAHYFGEVPHGWRFFSIGWAGVDVFFCLSGYLIGGILLDNRESSSYFLTFYIRRAFRIFPIYFVTIFIVLLIIEYLLKHGVSWIDAPLPAFSYFTYSQNFLLAINNNQGNTWLLPTWTLCVEEQFYLILPIIIYVIKPERLLHFLIFLILLASGLRFMLMTMNAGDLALHVLLPTRWDLLFLGVVGAYLIRQPDLWAKLMAREKRPLKVMILISAAMMVISVLLDKIFSVKSFDVLGSLFIGICCTSFLLLIVAGTPEGKRFRAKILCNIGSISYGLYLIHQPIAGLMHGIFLNERPDVGSISQILVTIGAFVVSICVATISWKMLERPLIQFGHMWQYIIGQSESHHQPFELGTADRTASNNPKIAFSREAPARRVWLLRLPQRRPGSDPLIRPFGASLRA